MKQIAILKDKGKGNYSSANPITKENILLLTETRLSQYENDVPFLTKLDVPQTAEQLTVASAVEVAPLEYYAVATNFPAGNKFYPATPKTVTLDVGDNDFGRVDLILANRPSTVGGMGYINVSKGIPSLNYAPNNIDLATQYIIRWIYVAPNAIVGEDVTGTYSKTKLSEFVNDVPFITIGNVTKEQVGLSNVDDTSDIDKPISTAQQEALDGKVDDSQVLTNVPLGALFTDTVYDDSDVLKDADSLTAVTPTNKLMTQSDVSGLGGGDMLSSVWSPIIIPTVEKVTPIDPDRFNLWDSVSSTFKYLTITNLKTFLKLYFDGFYQAILVSGTNIKTVNGSSILGGGDVTISGGTTNLTYTSSPINGLVNSDTGTDATIPLATVTIAGLVSPDQFTKLANTSGVNTGDQDISVKQDVLVSGTSIKTVNGSSLLGSGDVDTGNGTTNLTYTASPTNGIVNSDTGTDATIPLGTGTNAGLLTPAQFTKLASTSGVNTGDQDLSVKQDVLVSSSNIKTINGSSILGSGDITISGGTTNLTYTSSSTNGVVNSDTGTDATIPLGTSIIAGLLAPAQFTKLANTSGTNTGDQDLSVKQNVLVSGTNIKTVNGSSLLGSGNLTITAAATNLGATHAATNVTITSSTGTSAVVNAATTSLSGVVSNTTQSFAGAKTFTSSISSPDFIGTSDVRLKENIEVLDIKELKSTYKSFNFKGNDQARVGVIAQELEIEHPEFVRTDEDGMKSVSYSDLHSAEIAYLKSRVEYLESAIILLLKNK